MKTATIRINDQDFLAEVLDGPSREEDEYCEKYEDVWSPPAKPARPAELSGLNLFLGRHTTDPRYAGDEGLKRLRRLEREWEETETSWKIDQARWEANKETWEKERKVVGDFRRATALIVACCRSFASTIEQIPEPNKIIVQFGVSLSGEACTPVLARAAGDAAFKVTIEWSGPPDG